MYFGIVGGLGPASTVDYYNGIISQYLAACGGYPRLIIDSVDMNAMMDCFAAKDLDGVSDIIVQSLERLKNAGAEYAAIASNTPHIVIEEIMKRSPLPVISIVEETCKHLAENNCRNVLIFGTAFTMRSEMYENELAAYGINAVTPWEKDIDALHSFIFPNLENGIVIPEDKRKMIAIAERYIEQYDIDCVILGCTEIPLMIKEHDLSVPVANTTQIHIDAIAKMMIENK